MTLYRVVDVHPYRGHEEEWDGLTLEEAAARVEDLYPVEAALVISDVEEGVDWPMRYVDDETGREVTMWEEDAPLPKPQAGAMQTTDGLGA